ncbi:hypothetical protein AX17_004720 [Amanita inopinata Kibby_2008]|nr:hypothetical protein AX17_004720 [Amanita inopinata Kibby_2008]
MVNETGNFTIAKAQLGLSASTPDSTVPKCYLGELKLHLALCPKDTHFRVTMEPKHGLGKITCLEKGCDNIIIPLVNRVVLEDGGKFDGLGSLSAYRRHIYEHPTHKRYRDERVNSAPAAASNGALNERPVTKRGASTLLQLLDFNTQNPARASKVAPAKRGSLTANSPIRRVSSLTRVRPKPEDSSATALQAKAAGTKQYGNSSVRLEVAPIKPLTEAKLQFTPVTQLAGGELKDKAPSLPFGSSVTVKTVESKIANLRMKNRNAQTALTSRYSSSRCSASDVQEMNELRESIQTNNSLIDYYDRLITSIMKVDPLSPAQCDGGVYAGTSSQSQSAYGDHGRGGVKLCQTNDAPLSMAPIASSSNPSPPEEIDSLDHCEIDSTSGDYQAFDYQSSSGDESAETALTRINPSYPFAATVDDLYSHTGDEDCEGHWGDALARPKAQPDAINQFLKMACNTEQFDGNVRVDQALEILGLRSQYDLIPGMAVALMPHQTIGVAWMMGKEASQLRGGALSDDMGLGKTIQMIAVMIKNCSQDPLCKTNLVIAPLALLDQWKLEIELKTNNGLSCLIYHGPNKPRRKEELMRYDVVLTTFTTMALEWPDYERERIKELERARRRKKPQGSSEIENSDDNGKCNSTKRRKLTTGLLFEMEFYRVVLDEAQHIRNKRTRMSRAVTNLQGTYRWCLTGTPIINSLADVYGYLRFLRVRPWHDFTEFQNKIGRLEKRNPKLAVSRLQTVITTFLLRRMKDSTLDGKRLIELPEKKVSLIKLDFSEEEREIYRMVEIKSQAKFNKYLREGTVLKNYHHVLILLLRLRQICSHPSLIQEGGSAYFLPGEQDNEMDDWGDDLARARRLVSPEFVVKMKMKLRDAALARMKAERESVDAVVEDDDCPICFDLLTDPVVTPCTHVFCRDCIVDVLNTPAAEGPDETRRYKENERPCPACRSPISRNKLFSRAAFESDGDEATQTGHLKAKHEDSDEDDLDDFIVSDSEERCTPLKRLFKKKTCEDQESLADEDADVLLGASSEATRSETPIKLMPRFLPSTKMKYMMEQIRKTHKEKPDEKILIVSQWTSCLSLVSDYLAEWDISYVKYQGDMNRVARDKAIREFMSESRTRVMLMSLKCGGVGLNLTRANNVISLDLGWSQAVESQAYDRVHRLGQTRPVHVQRLVISNTVEDRVLELQQRKQMLADGSLGEGAGKKIGRLSVRELANLFGLDLRGHRITNYD